MTNPSPDPLDPGLGFESTLRDGALPEAELAAAIRGRRAGSGRTGNGPVRWVRVADAVAELGSATAGRGIDLHSELARRLRSAPATAQPVITDRIRSVAPAVRAVLASRAGEEFGRTR